MLGFKRKPFLRIPELELGGGARPQFAQLPFECGDDAQLIQNRRAKFHRDAPSALRSGVGGTLDALQQRRGPLGLGRQQAARAIGIQLDDGQGLTQIVMNSARDLSGVGLSLLLELEAEQVKTFFARGDLPDQALNAAEAEAQRQKLPYE